MIKNICSVSYKHGFWRLLCHPPIPQTACQWARHSVLLPLVFLEEMMEEPAPWARPQIKWAGTSGLPEILLEHIWVAAEAVFISKFKNYFPLTFSKFIFNYQNFHQHQAKVRKDHPGEDVGRWSWLHSHGQMFSVTESIHTELTQNIPSYIASVGLF